MPGGCRPRLYVYHLPEGYRDPLDTRGRGFGKPITPNNPELVRGLQISLYDSDAYAGLGDIFYERSLAYRCRTRDPVTADLFLVPAFSGQIGAATNARTPSGLRCAEVRNYTREVWQHAPDALFLRLYRINDGGGGRPRRGWFAVQSALERRGGADHILLNPRHGTQYEANPYCELDLLDPRLGNPVRLSIEAPFDETRRLRDDVYQTVPWPSAIHLDARDIAEGRVLPWQSRHLRDFLVGIAFGQRRVQKGSGRLVREVFARSCVAAARKCLMHSIQIRTPAANLRRSTSVDPSMSRLLVGAADSPADL